MKKNIALFLAFSLFGFHLIKAQDSCMTAVPFCTGTLYGFNTMPGIAAPSGPDYGCLGSESSPLWFSIHVTSAGPLTITGQGLDSSDNALDIDFIYWGPFSSLSGVCYTQLDAAHILGCDYTTSNLINVDIPFASSGSYYMVMISNYAGIPANISYAQTAGSGVASCVAPCSFVSMTATPGACNPATNTYSVTGTMTFANPPATGTLTVFGSCGGSQSFSPPFSSPMNYTFSGLGADGSSCFVTALFSANSSCNINQVYTAPALCNPSLSVTENAAALSGLKIDPNPSTGLFNLAFNAGSLSDISIAITDISGRIVYRELLANYSGAYAKQVDLTAFDKGIYFVRISSEKGSFTRKIIYN
jgi:hypothetical protein